MKTKVLKGQLVLLEPSRHVDTLAHRVKRVLRKHDLVILRCGRTTTLTGAKSAPSRWSDVCFDCEEHFEPGDIVTHRRFPNYPGHRVLEHLADVVTLECGIRFPQVALRLQEPPWPTHRRCRT